MRCLAIQQPWAWAICAGFKRIENRTWNTQYRGPVAIVASAKQTRANDAVRHFTGGRLPKDTLAFSAIIGTAVLTDVVPLSAAVEDDPHAYGPLCWRFDQPIWFQKAIRTTAKLRLYESTAAEAKRIEEEAARPSQPLDKEVYATFARSLEDDPVERVFRQANLFMNEERWADVERAADRALAIDPAAAVGPFLQAHVAFNAGKLRDSLEYCTRAIELEPDWADLYWGRVSIYEKLGDKRAAAADHARAIELDPTLAEEEQADRPDDE